MYSPKIKEELIPKIYRLAKARGIRMTTFVNEILSKDLDEGEGGKDGKEERRDSVRQTGENQGRDSGNPALDR
jgi:hypothetical protein